MCQYFIPFDGQAIPHCMESPYFVYPSRMVFFLFWKKEKSLGAVAGAEFGPRLRIILDKSLISLRVSFPMVKRGDCPVWGPRLPHRPSRAPGVGEPEVTVGREAYRDL